MRAWWPEKSPEWAVRSVAETLVLIWSDGTPETWANSINPASGNA
jgi:hypothetical protein